MGTWIEIRCDTFGDDCYSARNHGPTGMSGDTAQDALSKLRTLGKEARESGWKKNREGWVCPSCAKSKVPRK